MCITRGSTAADILQEHGVSWEYCVSVGMDDPSVKLGRRNSVMTRVMEKNPAVFFNGCPCHNIPNNASKAGDVYRITGVDVEDFYEDVYYWLDRSTKILW